MAATDVITTAELKAHLNITDSSSDTELAGFVSAASRVVDRYVGPVVVRSVTQVFDGGRCRVLLSQIPVSSVTSVTDSGTVLAASSYKIDTSAGVLTRVSGSDQVEFEPGIQSLTVVFAAGRVAATADVATSYGDFRLAALIIGQHMWDTQRPAAAGPFTQGTDDYDPRYSYSVPRRALELLGEPVGGIA